MLEEYLSLKAFNGKAGLFLRSVGYFVLQPSNAKSSCFLCRILQIMRDFCFLSSFVIQFAI